MLLAIAQLIDLEDLRSFVFVTQRLLIKLTDHYLSRVGIKIKQRSFVTLSEDALPALPAWRRAPTFTVPRHLSCEFGHRSSEKDVDRLCHFLGCLAQDHTVPIRHLTLDFCSCKIGSLFRILQALPLFNFRGLEVDTATCDYLNRPHHDSYVLFAQPLPNLTSFDVTSTIFLSPQLVEWTVTVLNTSPITNLSLSGSTTSTALSTVEWADFLPKIRIDTLTAVSLDTLPLAAALEFLQRHLAIETIYLGNHVFVQRELSLQDRLYLPRLTRISGPPLQLYNVLVSFSPSRELAGLDVELDLTKTWSIQDVTTLLGYDFGYREVTVENVIGTDHEELLRKLRRDYPHITFRTRHLKDTLKYENHDL